MLQEGTQKIWLLKKKKWSHPRFKSNHTLQQELTILWGNSKKKSTDYAAFSSSTTSFWGLYESLKSKCACLLEFISQKWPWMALPLSCSSYHHSLHGLMCCCACRIVRCPVKIHQQKCSSGYLRCVVRENGKLEFSLFFIYFFFIFLSTLFARRPPALGARMRWLCRM